MRFRYGIRVWGVASNWTCERPMGFRYSSNSISPGCVGGPCVGMRTTMSSLVSKSFLAGVVGRSMVIRDLHAFLAVIVPNETYPELAVDL